MEVAKRFNLFDEFQVWTPSDGSGLKDRLVVGIIKEPGGRVRYFKVGHWGDPMTPPSVIRDSIRRADRTARRTWRWGWFKRHKKLTIFASVVATLILLISVLVMLPKPVQEAEAPSTPTIEVAGEEPGEPIEKSGVIAEDEPTDEASVESAEKTSASSEDERSSFIDKPPWDSF